MFVNGALMFDICLFGTAYIMEEGENYEMSAKRQIRRVRLRFDDGVRRATVRAQEGSRSEERQHDRRALCDAEPSKG